MEKDRGNFDFRLAYSNTDTIFENYVKRSAKTLGKVNVWKILLDELINPESVYPDTFEEIEDDNCEQKTIIGNVTIKELLNKSKDISTSLYLNIHKGSTNGEIVAQFPVHNITKKSLFTLKWDGKYNVGSKKGEFLEKGSYTITMSAIPKVTDPSLSNFNKVLSVGIRKTKDCGSCEDIIKEIKTYYSKWPDDKNNDGNIDIPNPSGKWDKNDTNAIRKAFYLSKLSKFGLSNFAHILEQHTGSRDYSLLPETGKARWYYDKLIFKYAIKSYDERNKLNIQEGDLISDEVNGIGEANLNGIKIENIKKIRFVFGDSAKPPRDKCEIYNIYPSIR